MSYQPLARKYRPHRFSELVGQETVASALTNAIGLKRQPHAVIFSGVRGIGKTTTARLYAKALNCTDPTENHEPCNQCPSCLTISQGCHEDVLEIDGASNTSVDDIRVLKETVHYAPQRSSFKVYIIDEVHMLSQSAFNALLKTLEEPPNHVIFIFATTELNKVPQTIVSRCQTYYLKKISLQTIYNRLELILNQEQIPFENKALAMIAKEGHGSMRDALTLLDQTIAVGDGHVSTAALEGMVSFSSSSTFLQLLKQLLDRDVQGALETIASCDQQGTAFSELVEESARFSRHAFVIKTLGPEAIDTALLGLDESESHSLLELAELAKSFDLNRIFRTLLQCRQDLDGSSLDRYITENYIIEWCLDPGLSIQDILSPAANNTGNQVPLANHHLGANSERRSKKSNLVGAFKQSLTRESTFSKAPLTRAKTESEKKPEQNEPSQNLKPDMPAKAELPQDISRQESPHKTAVDQDPVNHSPASLDRPSSPKKSMSAETPTLELFDQDPVSSESELSYHSPFPGSWRQFVDSWKQEKPLQARKLEEAHCFAYSADLIHLKVNAESLVGATLLKEEEQTKLSHQFQALFSFSGKLLIEPLDDQNDPKTSNIAPESLLEIKEREISKKHSKIEDQARSSELIQELVDSLSGTIVDIEIKGDGSNA